MEFPPDILQEIFILAGQEDNPSRWTLALVSKYVQKWTDPVVFLHLSFEPEDEDEIHQDNFDEFVVFLCWKEHTDRFTRALSHVKTLLLGFSLGRTEIPWQSILAKFPNLVAVSTVRGYDWLEFEAFDEPHPTLRYACGAFASSVSHMDSSFKALSNITYLEMDDDYSFTYWAEYFVNWTLFTNLKYVSCNIAELENIWAEDVESMLVSLPSSVLLFLAFVTAESIDKEPLRDYADMKYGHRFLLCCTSTPPQDWILQVDKPPSALAELRGDEHQDGSFWERGLKMVEERRRIHYI
ncbi:hypothetical protein DL96DRAFT_1614076 [Flagelloscypha sp. PMI_526]|nr:hypothetical protein DL96DRAFT_1614076 [Flagelloscypha sp. PMI_526]